MAPSTQVPAQGGMERKPKTIFQLDSPFTTVQWPQISSQNQNTILELLCSLLSPIGQYRASHVTPSKGKRSKKRKRREAKLGKGGDVSIAGNAPSLPDISKFIAVGLNSVTRSLEALSKSSKPIKLSGSELLEEASNEATLDVDPPETLSNQQKEARITAPFSAIFVSRSSQPSILHAHLPQLLVTASLAYPNCPPTRLVQLSTGSEERLCQALGIPRVSFLGLIEGAPFSKSLIDLIRDYVAPVEIPWLVEVEEAKYLPVKINTIQTFATSVPKKS